MSDTFVEFSAARKSLIAHGKERLTNRDNLRREANEYGNRAKKLFLRDYAVYASVRGADYRKASHMEDGANAKVELQGLHGSLANFLVKNEDFASKPVPVQFARFAPDSASLVELEECRKASLAL